MAKEILSHRLDVTLIARLDALAESTGQSRSEIVERVLLNGIDQAEQFVKQFESPVLREAWGVLSSPAVLRALSKLGGEPMPPSEVERISTRTKRLVKRGREKGRGKGGRAETA